MLGTATFLVCPIPLIRANVSPDPSSGEMLVVYEGPAEQTIPGCQLLQSS